VLNKRIDAAIAPDFTDKMKKVFADGRQLFIFDLSRVDAVDSTGLGALLFCLKTVKAGRSCFNNNDNGKPGTGAGAEAEAGEIILTGVSATVMTLLKLTRMDRLFHIRHGVHDALDFFAGR